ncbi:hypothetical protein [Nonomuraea aurantiaca]|uniref:hypothetical protein n=1 Tax=Nonomuraea aurantiaca TaxID=2878562 RepID=UPI001CDA36B2|nr:hypothetical protein [Nonomuraea aurantiaca]MCA2230218.1 hypothetical protein [Nonomuraea aurantiaca]
MRSIPTAGRPTTRTRPAGGATFHQPVGPCLLRPYLDVLPGQVPGRGAWAGGSMRRPGSDVAGHHLNNRRTRAIRSRRP